MKRIISRILAITILISACTFVNTYAGSSFGWSLPTSYDMSGGKIPNGYMSNLNEGAYGYFADPTNAANTVLGIKTILRSDNIYSGADLRCVVQNTDTAIQFVFDIFREDCSNNFQFEIKPSDSVAYGSAPEKAFRFSTNQSFVNEPTNGKSVPVLNNTWYTFKVFVSKNHKKVSIYYKLRDSDSFEYAWDVDLSQMDFDGHSIMFYLKNNSRNGFTYLDNMSWSEIEDVLFDLEPNQSNVSINQAVNATFNEVIDVENSSFNASFADEQGNSIGANVKLSDSGAVITPSSTLSTDTKYVLVSDVNLVNKSGDVIATTYELPFYTQQPLLVEGVSLNSGSNLNKSIFGNNTFNYTLTSADGFDHPYIALMIAYDKDTGERLAVSSKGGTVSAKTPTKTYLSLSLSGMNNFVLECYIWSGVLSMKPMTGAFVY